MLCVLNEKWRCYVNEQIFRLCMYIVAVRCSGNGVGRIKDVTLLSPVSTGRGDRLRAGIPPRYITSHPGKLSLAIPQCTGDGFGHRQGRNSEFCVTVGTVTRTACILI